MDAWSQLLHLMLTEQAFNKIKHKCNLNKASQPVQGKTSLPEMESKLIKSKYIPA